MLGLRAAKPCKQLMNNDDDTLDQPTRKCLTLDLLHWDSFPHFVVSSSLLQALLISLVFYLELSKMQARGYRIDLVGQFLPR